MLEQILASIKNEEEAALVLSYLGINWVDWPLLMKLGGPLQFLKSDLLIKSLEQKISCDPNAQFILTLRELLDKFYREKGFLITPKSSLCIEEIKGAPLVFFGRFNRAVLDVKNSIAIVGSRKADQDALKLARNLSSILAKRGINIISGGANGIDFAAHEAALSTGGTTLIVSGVACSFASSDINSRLRSLALENACVLFPYGPTTPQGKFMFVERNQYVVALAKAVVVVQGDRASGTLHTARFAKKLGIALYAVPGALMNPLSYAPNQLLGEGSARALVDFDQFAAALVTKSPKPLKSQEKVEMAKSAITSHEPLPPLLKLLKDKGKQASLDELIIWSGRSYLSIQQDMLRFEMDGLVFKRGSQFVLADN